MIKYIAAFRSRSQTMRLFQAAKNSGIPCSVINTPREASIGCGISLYYCPEHHRAVYNLYSGGNYDALIGFYRMEKDVNGGTHIFPLKT